MPIIRKTDALVNNPLQLSFVDRLKKGRVVPVVSGAALADLTLGGHSLLTRRLSEYMNYPLPDNDRVVHIARYYKLQHNLKNQDLKFEYLNFIKNFIYFLAKEQGATADLLVEAEAQVDDLTVSEFAKVLGYPQFDEPDDPLMVLTNLPIKVYLTTSPYTIIEEALSAAGKEPVTELCRWQRSHDGIDQQISSTYQPDAQHPLVYHLHGWDKYPDSLVLTEDDHLEFLVNICQGKGNDTADRVHGIVRQALFDDLIMLGFRLSDWGFRALYAGLIRSSSRQDDRGVCVLQLVENKVEQQYLQDYLEKEAKFNVFWGNVSDYGPELLRLLNLREAT